MNIDSLMNAISTTACHAGEASARTDRNGRITGGSGSLRSFSQEPTAARSNQLAARTCNRMMASTWSGACGMVHGWHGAFDALDWNWLEAANAMHEKNGQKHAHPLQLQGKPGTAPHCAGP